ncbi:hypothetical protein KY314_01540 [Candidatus Woesearchaeota archaeon]|nr:hypothetical protein [Candidatus Woesearchaeota archaeon]
MKTKILSVLSVLLIMLMATSAIALPISVERVEIDGERVDNNAARLDVQRGQEVEVELTLVPSEDIEDVEIMAFISGYEYNDIEAMADSIGPISMESGVKYRKTLHITLPEDVEEDDYKLRLLFTNRNGEDMISLNYQLKIDLPRHKLTITDVIFHPGKNVKAGTALLGQVRLENMGEKDEDDIVVKIMIPELGVSATDYVDEIETGEQEETEEIYLRIPESAEPGIYQAQVYVGYNNDHDKLLATSILNVEANQRLQEPTEETVVVVEQLPEETTQEITPATNWKNTIKTVLEVVLLVLVALLVVIGLIIGFTRLGRD